MKFVLATQNPFKRKEMSIILQRLSLEVVTEEELGIHVEVEETGSTFWENATLKAKAVMEASGLPAIADDSGLCVHALNDAPGIYSARYGGEDLDDLGRCKLVLDSLRGQRDRSAHYHSSIVCAFPNGDVLRTDGECRGIIIYTPLGDGGFGYDPIFLVPHLRRTFAQLDQEEKDAISHRGQALRNFEAKLRDYQQKNGGLSHGTT